MDKTQQLNTPHKTNLQQDKRNRDTPLKRSIQDIIDIRKISTYISLVQELKSQYQQGMFQKE